MKYNDEYATVRLAIKKARKFGINAGFNLIKKYADSHTDNRDVDGILKCYRKAIKKGVC